MKDRSRLRPQSNRWGRALSGILISLWLTAPLPAQSAAADAIPWERLTTGMHVALWNPRDTCPQVPALLMLQIDPERFRFSVYQFRDEGLRAPISIHDCRQHRTDAYVMFNAGLFREDYSYLGVLLKEGRSLEARNIIRGKDCSPLNQLTEHFLKSPCLTWRSTYSRRIR
ncbi:MAG: hypothetical protein MRJ92_11995 [Nitrospira sp.]|nr:hypothetical protein [Nitrospira sp.]